MISRRNAIFAALAGLSAGAPFLADANLAHAKTSWVAQFDTDKDGTVDLDEAKKAASATFDRLDTDKDGTVTIKELQGRLSRKEFAAGDPDHDKTLTKEEYLAIVEQRFKAADRDNDGTISEAEFHTPAGRALRRLLH